MVDPTPLTPNRNYPLPHPDNPSARQDIQRIRDALNDIDGDVSEALAELMTQAEVDSTIADAIAGLIDSAPATLDTLNELAAALGQDQNFAATMTAKLADKANTTDAAEGAFDWIGDLSGTHIYTAAANAHAPAALRNGKKIRARVANANTSATPTLNYAGFGAKAIVRFDLSPLSKGEMRAGSIVEFVYHSAPDKWLLMTNGAASRPNLLKNPAFERWPDGTSWATAKNGQDTAENWIYVASGAVSAISRITLTESERSELSAGSPYAHRLDTAQGPDDFAGIYQDISDVRKLAGRTVTISGYIRGTASKLRLVFQQLFGVGGSPSSAIVKYPAVTITEDEFKFFSATLEIPDVDDKTVVESGPNITRIFLANPFFEGAWFDLAELKLEVGAQATPFLTERTEPEPEIQPLVKAFTGSGTVGPFDLTVNPGTEANVQVTIDGVAQHATEWSLSGTNLTFNESVPSGAAIEVRINGQAGSTTVPADGSVTTAKIANNSVTAAKIAPSVFTPDKMTRQFFVAHQAYNSVVSSATVAGDNLRQLNGILTDDFGTVYLNPGGTISGLPAGRYHVNAWVSAYGASNPHQAFLYNSTDGVVLLAGRYAYAGSSTGTDTIDLSINGIVTLPGSKNVQLRHWASTGYVNGEGYATVKRAGLDIVHAHITMERIGA